MFQQLQATQMMPSSLYTATLAQTDNFTACVTTIAPLTRLWILEALIT